MEWDTVRRMGRDRSGHGGTVNKANGATVEWDRKGKRYCKANETGEEREGRYSKECKRGTVEWDGKANGGNAVGGGGARNTVLLPISRNRVGPRGCSSG